MGQEVKEEDSKVIKRIVCDCGSAYRKAASGTDKSNWHIPGQSWNDTNGPYVVDLRDVLNSEVATVDTEVGQLLRVSKYICIGCFNEILISYVEE